MNCLPVTTNQKLVIGLGSSHGDDRAGWLVAQVLQSDLARPGFDIRIAKSPADVLDWIDGIEQLIICDASYGLGHVGEMHQWQWPTDALTAETLSGTHNFPLILVLELADKLGKLPNNVEIWTVEGRSYAPNSELSPEVRVAAQRMARRLASDWGTA